MIIKSVTQVGNPIIRRKSKKVMLVTSPKIKKIINDLTDSMRHSNLVGMSAPQIGQNLRVFVTEIRTTTLRKTKELDKLRVFINPRIINKSKKLISGFEGCGSVAMSGIFGKVPRSKKITVSALDENGKKFILTTTGLLARVIQHEFDHLEGIIFLDKVFNKNSLMSREEYLKI
jgi:peptide deformylase